MRLLPCAFFIFIVCQSFSQSGTDSLVNSSSGNISSSIQTPTDSSLSQINNSQATIASNNESSIASDSLSRSQKRKEARKQRNKNVKSKSQKTLENKELVGNSKNVTQDKISKDSVGSKLKDKAANNKLSKEYQSKYTGVAGKGKDSTALKDSVSNKLKDKARNSELNTKITSKYQGVAGIGKDSLAKDSIKNNLKNKTSDQLKNKMPGQFQGMAGKKDSLMNGNLGDTLKSKAKAKVTGKVTDVKDGLTDKKDSLLSQGKSKVKNLKTNSVSFVKGQVKAMKPTGSISVGYEYGVIPFVVGDKYPSGGFRSEGSVSMFVFKVPIEFTYNYSTIKNTIGLNNYYRISYDANRYKDVVSEKLNATYKMDVDQLDKLQVQQQQLMQKTEMLSFLKNNPYCKVPSANSLKSSATSKLNTDNLKDSLGNNIPDTTGMLSSVKKPNSENLKTLSPEDLKNNTLSKSNLPGMKDSLGSIIPDTTGKLASLKTTGNVVVKDNPATDLDFKMKKDTSGLVAVDSSKINSAFDETKTDSIKNNSEIKKNKFVSKFNIKKRNDSLNTKTADSTDVSASKPVSDSIGVNSNDSIQSAPSDSVGHISRKDSLSKEFSACKEKYDSVSTEIEKIKSKIEKVKRIIENPMGYADPYLTKAQRFLSGIKKLEIGLCNPNYSTFLVNNVPLQGINIEYGKKDKFVAFSYGTTVATLLYNPNTLQGTLQGVRNLYNYFDFGNLSAGRKIICLKGGFGEKEETHLHGGFLLGKGRADYMHTGVDAGPLALSKESNLVLEIDGKYKFNEQMSFDFILGKSSVKENDLSMEQVSSMLNEALSTYRSYALSAKFNLGIIKTNTKFTFGTRWIDPYFKSFGLGFLRSDNWRYEVKAEQQITKKIKYSIAYRKEEDNLLRLYNYKNTLQSINNSLNIKLNRRFNIRLNYIPLFRELKSESVTIKDRNQIVTAILSYTPKAKKITSQFNALYSNYLVNADSGNINFENFTYTQQLQFKSGFKTGFNASWFKNNLQDTLGNDTWLGVLDIGYAAKNGGNFSIGGKMAYKEGIETQYGFIAKVSVKVYKGLFWEAQAEKILLGDYYNSFIIGQIEKFPYYCNTRLVLTF